MITRAVSAAAALLAAVFTPAASGQDANAAIEKIRPALVNVVSYDAKGRVLNEAAGFVAGKDGQVITGRRHLLGAVRAAVKGSGTYTVSGVVAESVSADLVLLSVRGPAAGLSPAAVTETPLEVGDTVIVASNRAAGTVSAVRDVPGLGRVVRITAPVPPEAGGSPVLNAKGEVAGIALWQLSGPETAGLAACGENLQAVAAGKVKPLAAWNASAPKNVTADAEAEYRAGLNQLLLDEYAAALSSFEKAIEKSPRYAEAWFHSGFAKAKLGRQKEKMAAYREAVRLKPDYAAARYSLGMAYALAGEAELALIQHKALAAVDPVWAEKLRVLIHYAAHHEDEDEHKHEPAPKDEKEQRRLL